MAIAWVLTIPAAAAIAYVLAKFAAFTHPVVAYACSAASVAGDSVCRRARSPQTHAAGRSPPTRAAGLLVWARMVMATAKGRHDVEAAVQQRDVEAAVQQLAEMPEVRLLPAAARSDDAGDDK